MSYQLPCLVRGPLVQTCSCHVLDMFYYDCRWTGLYVTSRDGVAHWVARLTRNVEVVGSSPIKGTHCFFEQETLPLLLSTGWLQERIRAWFHNRTKINWGPYGRRLTEMSNEPPQYLTYRQKNYYSISSKGEGIPLISQKTTNTIKITVLHWWVPETGRWHAIDKRHRVCSLCQHRKPETTHYCLFICTNYIELQKKM